MRKNKQQKSPDETATGEMTTGAITRSEPANERELFIQALEIEDESAREAFLVSKCQGDPHRLNAIRKLLAEHNRPSQFVLDKPLFSNDPSVSPTSQPRPFEPGDRIESWTLESLLGEGGMGEVWEVSQSEPVKRRMALKLIRQGRDSPGIRQRFETERQALASMNHPGIARVLDGGTTQYGQPWFVMELVDGVSMRQYCEEEELSVAARMKLLVQVAYAVQHAHLKGIIHRDLKPSNVLVTKVDGHPAPKVIDFGLAKAIGAPQTEDTQITRAGVFLGTLDYMSPEQAGYEGQDIDTRTDVYALGAMMYELLTGFRPLEDDDSGKAALDERLRMIREQTPPRPSTRKRETESEETTSGSSRTITSDSRETIPADLDWIVMKAIEKDRERRYETPASFADDVSRFLAGEPVLAHPPSKSYRVRKFIAKHRLMFGSATAVATAIIVGICGLSWGVIRANKEADRASRAELVAIGKQELADEARQNAQDAADEEARQREYAQAIADFVTQDFLALTSLEGQYRFDSTSLNRVGRNASLVDLLDRASSRLAKRNDLSADIRAELHWMIGISYRANGQAIKAIPHLRESVRLNESVHGKRSRVALDSRNSLVVAIGQSGRYDLSRQLGQELLGECLELLGDNDRLTLFVMKNLSHTLRHLGDFEQAESLNQRVLSLAREAFGDDDAFTLKCQHLLATIWAAQHQLDKAIALGEQTKSLREQLLGSSHPDTIESEIFVAVTLNNIGHHEQSLHMFGDVLARADELLGSDHPQTLDCMAGMAEVYRKTGKIDDAITLGRQTADQFALALGRDHPRTRQVMNNLALSLMEAKQLDEALLLFTESLELDADGQTVIHSDSLPISNNLAVCLGRMGRLDESLEILERNVGPTRQQFGETHSATFDCRVSIAHLYRQRGRYEEALTMLREMWSLIESADTEPTLPSIYILDQIGVTLWGMRRLDESVPVFEEVLQHYRRHSATDHPKALVSSANLGVNYLEAGRIEDAIPLLEKAHQESASRTELVPFSDWLRYAYVKAGRDQALVDLVEEQEENVRNQQGPQSIQLASFLSSAGQDLLDTDQFESAERLLRESVAIRRAVAPTNQSTWIAISMLGETLTELERFEEAQTLLEESLEGLTSLPSPPSTTLKSRVLTAFDRRIRLAERRRNQDEAEIWREKKATYESETMTRQ